MNVPNKICHFIWKAAIDSLPTKKNLQLRNIIQGPTCDRYDEDVEDSIHALWGCQMVKHIWLNWNAKRVESTSLPTKKIYNDAIEQLQEFHSVQEEPLQQDMVSHPA